MGVEPRMAHNGARVLGVVAALLTGLSLTGCHGADDAWWGLRTELGPDDTVVPITVRVGSSSCNRFEGITVTETDEAVTITASVERLASRDCTSDLQFQGVDVPLDRPLGERELEGCGHVDRRPCDEVASGAPG